MDSSQTRRQLKDARRIVIKIGTRVVTGTGPGLDLEFLDRLARQVARLRPLAVIKG